MSSAEYHVLTALTVAGGVLRDLSQFAIEVASEWQGTRGSMGHIAFPNTVALCTRRVLPVALA